MLIDVCVFMMMGVCVTCVQGHGCGVHVYGDRHGCSSCL